MFEESRLERVSQYPNNEELIRASRALTKSCLRNGYSYNFSWLGADLIQFPEDIIALQSLIFQEKPSLIIETGLAHGGSAIFCASMLHLVSMFKSADDQCKPHVISVDLNVKPEALVRINNSPFANSISLVEGSSVSEDVQFKIKSKIRPGDKVMVILDSCHTTDHVLAELNLFSDFVSSSCSLIVCDTSVGVVGPAFDNCKYGVNEENNPLVAVDAFLKSPKGQMFESNNIINDGLMLSCNFYGYLMKK